VGELREWEKKQGGFFLEALSNWDLKLPGYRILYTQTAEKKMATFSAKKLTPIGGEQREFIARDFLKFLAFTISHYRKKHQQEKI
jgi:hypothetical protein